MTQEFRKEQVNAFIDFALSIYTELRDKRDFDSYVARLDKYTSTVFPEQITYVGWMFAIEAIQLAWNDLLVSRPMDAIKDILEDLMYHYVMGE